MLPLLKPVIAIILVIRFADAFRIFDVVYVLTGSGPANATDVLSTFIYRQMFSAFDFAGGAAASIILVIVTAHRLARRHRCASLRGGPPHERGRRQSGYDRRRCRSVGVLSSSSAVIFLVPLLWILSTSLKTPGEIFSTPTTMLPQSSRRLRITPTILAGRLPELPRSTA